VGIWMWGEPILVKGNSGEKYAVILLDTQGAFDNQSTYQECTTIFALSTILSSLQIYNVVDTIQGRCAANLSLFLDYGRMAALNEKRQSNPFQPLCFCVRDFKSPEEYPFGGEGGRLYLEQVFEKSPRQASELTSIRNLLTSCFESLSCFLLPHPGTIVAERSTFNGDVKDLRPEFRDEIRRMVETLLSPEALKPKIIDGKPATCKRMIEYFK
ncbi:hypothetical protein PFISCL1PPCAC_982, partial [Pristionchus fissidentatus]